MNVCRICHMNPAEVPDRNHGMPGRQGNRLCLNCHRDRILDDIQMLIDLVHAQTPPPAPQDGGTP